MLGTSMLRRILRRSNQSAQYSATIGGLAMLVGKLVDLAATLTPLNFERLTKHQSRFRNLADTVARIRNDLINDRVPGPVHFDPGGQSAAAVPFLSEMEQTVALIPQVLADSRSVDQYLPSVDDLPEPTLLSPDAFVNPEHLRFAQKGCLAASACYVMYNALAWPGISTAVTTCLLTAVSTIGASHQKQLLRILGAIAGGFVLGMSSQAFILPYLDSITGFVVLFVLVTALSSWFLTSSPRLSYFGIQVALAFYLVNLEEFRIQTSLSIARDRVVGILLGLFAMWLVFDRLWGAPAIVEMKRSFVSNLRLMARLAKEPLSSLKIAMGQTLALRETINANLDKTRALADSVLFEFGPSRQKDLELRSQIRRWQPELRALFLMRIASLKYRLGLPGFEVPASVRLCQQAYDEVSARMLEEMADRIEGRDLQIGSSAEATSVLARHKLQDAEAAAKQELPAAQGHSFVTLLGEIDSVTNSLAGQIAIETAGWSQ
jgi:multidrug resistance protein MdtO